jgi:exopolysaccharide production protein ExoZ
MYKSLQACRAIASVMIVLLHLGGTISSENYFGIKLFSILFSFCHAGVPLFFVLSGFIIFNAHYNDISKPSKLAIYIKKRLIRVYPIYWIIFVLTLSVTSFLSPDTVPHDIFVIVAAFLLIPQDMKLFGDVSPVVGVAWTLQYEIFFYFFFAVTILNRWLSIAIGTIVLCAYFFYSNQASLTSFPVSFLVRGHYILLFAMGMAVSILCIKKKNINISWLYTILSAGLVLFIFVALDTVTGINSLEVWQTRLYGISSMLIFFGLVNLEKKGHIIGGGDLLQTLGSSSYALYLIHYPLIIVMSKLSLLLHLDKIGIFGGIISFSSILFVCLICSIKFHLWIEQPIARYLKNRFLIS